MRSLGRNNNTHIHTHIFRDTYRVEAVRRSRQEPAGLKFTLHRRCKQEAEDGGTDGSVRREWEAELMVSTPSEM